MWVRMEPKCCAGLIDFQHQVPDIAWFDGLLRPPVIVAGHEEAMSMHGGERVERVFDGYLHFIAAPHANDWSKNRP